MSLRYKFFNRPVKPNEFVDFLTKNSVDEVELKGFECITGDYTWSEYGVRHTAILGDGQKWERDMMFSATWGSYCEEGKVKLFRKLYDEYRLQLGKTGIVVMTGD